MKQIVILLLCVLVTLVFSGDVIPEGTTPNMETIAKDFKEAMNWATPQRKAPVQEPVVAMEINGEVLPKIRSGFEVILSTTADKLTMFLSFFQSWGYKVVSKMDGHESILTPPYTNRLYGYAKNITSYRLRHKSATRGYIRIMVFKETQPGLRYAPFIVPGARWISTLTDDVMKLTTQLDYLNYTCGPSVNPEKPCVDFVQPQYQQVYKAANGVPFLDDILVVKELRALWEVNLVVYQRFAYTIPLYGDVDKSAKYPMSQWTHAGVVYDGDTVEPGVEDDVIRFWKSFGLLLTSPPGLTTYTNTIEAVRQICQLKPTDRYNNFNLDDPTSSSNSFAATDGRFIFYRFLRGTNARPNLIEYSKPGFEGFSGYTFATDKIDAMKARVEATGMATEITPIVVNEFGERSFSFIGPEKYWWNVVETTW